MNDHDKPTPVPDPPLPHPQPGPGPTPDAPGTPPDPGIACGKLAPDGYPGAGTPCSLPRNHKGAHEARDKTGKVVARSTEPPPDPGITVTGLDLAIGPDRTAAVQWPPDVEVAGYRPHFIDMVDLFRHR